MRLRALGGATLTAALALLPASRLQAHCDTLDGPVIAAARAALKARDANPVLKWIPQESENEVRAAFARTLKVRNLSPEAGEVADLYFFETLVRLHRAGEGEPYTGLKPAGVEIDPTVAAADRALRSGSADALIREATAGVANEIRERFERASQSRKTAEQSVEAGRKYVAAYVELMHYLENLDSAGRGHEDHAAASHPDAHTR